MKTISIAICLVILSTNFCFGKTGIKKDFTVISKKNPAICCLSTALGMMSTLYNYTSSQEHLCIQPQTTAQGIIDCNNFWGGMYNAGVSYIGNWLTNCENINGTGGCGVGPIGVII